jgi:hypothetical protein
MSKTVVERFVDSAITHGETAATGDYKTGNKAYDRKRAAVVELRKLPDRGEAALVALLEHPNLWVKKSAATYLLPLREDLACATLERLELSSNKHLAFDAKMTLQEWRSGRLKLL